MKNKAIEKAIKNKRELAKEYNVPISSIVWVGNNHYIIVKNAKEMRI